ncbi:hypothetical protein JRQ81_004180 [Phrynocephalus forsythii]|uniref:Uncharacterized protein n=1 Tax=Phrynocephalus forsythii TaxID=171643 RepID=A0A9Q0XL62_9SAUR|nr:hypothetical protein JRQ81_004180 [Phrynocephalus forsythii]
MVAAISSVGNRKGEPAGESSFLLDRRVGLADLNLQERKSTGEGELLGLAGTEGIKEGAGRGGWAEEQEEKIEGVYWVKEEEWVEEELLEVVKEGCWTGEKAIPLILPMAVGMQSKIEFNGTRKKGPKRQNMERKGRKMSTKASTRVAFSKEWQLSHQQLPERSRSGTQGWTSLMTQALIQVQILQFMPNADLKRSNKILNLSE